MASKMRHQSIIRQRNSFDLQLLDGSISLSAPAINLYRALVSKSNFVAMKQFGDFYTDYFFRASDRDLQLLTGHGGATIRKARDELKEKQLIDYRKGRSFGEGRKPVASVYSIIYLDYHDIRGAFDSYGDDDAQDPELSQNLPSPLGQILPSALGQNLPSVNVSTESNLITNKDILDMYIEGNTHSFSSEQDPDLALLSARWFGYLSEKGRKLTACQKDRHLKKMRAAIRDYGQKDTGDMIDIAIENGWNSVHYDDLANRLQYNTEPQEVPEGFLH